jgi:protein SCO1
MKRLISIAVAAFALAACSKPAPPPPAGARVFEVRGVVRGVLDAESATIAIEHENIPGYMPSMTMPFTVKDRAQADGLKAGAGVAFRMVVTDTAAWIDSVKQIDAASVKLGAPEPKGPESDTPRLKEGDRWPGFTLKDQAGRTLTRADFDGAPVLVTFIFTRCPIPNFCPLMSRNFATLDKALAADPVLAGKVRLLSISFDTEYDTPEHLAQYAAQYAGRTDNWRLAGGTPEEIAKLTKAFSVYVRPEGGTISHGLCTALIGPDGVVRKMWRGNSWTTDEVLSEVRDQMTKPE